MQTRTTVVLCMVKTNYSIQSDWLSKPIQNSALLTLSFTAYYITPPRNVFHLWILPICNCDLRTWPIALWENHGKISTKSWKIIGKLGNITVKSVFNIQNCLLPSKTLFGPHCDCESVKVVSNKVKTCTLYLYMTKMPRNWETAKIWWRSCQVIN